MLCMLAKVCMQKLADSSLESVLSTHESWGIQLRLAASAHYSLSHLLDSQHLGFISEIIRAG